MTTLNSAASDTHAPVRSLCLPNPPAQTVFGVLHDSGSYTDSENITTLGPSFDWMSGMEIYLGSFTYGINDIGVLPKAKNIQPMVKYWWDEPIVHPHQLPNMDWHLIPFCASKFWQGTCTIRLLAIKPPRVTGKLIIRYSPDFSTAGSYPDTLMRGIKMEWDLGLTNDFSFEIPAYSTLKVRPTWLPRYSENDNAIFTVNRPRFIPWNFQLPAFHLGVFSVEAAQQLQPGSIFPDSIRILVFHSFKGSEFFMPTDMRGLSRHAMVISDYSLRVDVGT